MLGVDAVERKILETIVGECSHGFAGYAVSPEFLAQPVTKFCGVPMDVFTNPDSDSTRQPTHRSRCKSLLSAAHSLRAGGIASHHRRCMDAETNHADQAKFVGCSHVWLVTPRHRAAMAGLCSAQARAALVYFPSNLIPVFCTSR